MEVKIIFASLFQLFSTVLGLCFFNKDTQGHYLTQSTISRGSRIDYLEVVIQQNSIPVWGQCHRRFGNNVILYDMVGNEECMRCFLMVVRSPHILEVHTEGLERCYTNEGAALTKCPTQENKSHISSTEIMLYKTKNLLESEPLLPVYCPIEGKYTTTYDVNDGTEAETECPVPTSSFSNCPKGNEIRVAFHKCSFEDFEKSFECLGYWEGTNGHKYLALRDPDADPRKAQTSSLDHPSPTYRCAMYEEDSASGSIHVAFSSDSTCFNNLRTPSQGFETLVLQRVTHLPSPTIMNERKCRFPPWSQGKWEQLEVLGDSVTFTDLQEYKTYSLHCIGPPAFGFYPVFAKDQCGNEKFSCLKIQRRSANVIEFHISKNEDSYFDTKFCNTVYSDFFWPHWITQGRVDRYKESPCPVAGEYVGVLPDEPSFCAKLYSDCNNLEIMFYTVYLCSNKSRIFEEREYRCLGQWVESENTYTYTERRDVIGHECFAGVVRTTDEIFIVEAGTNCQRGLRPLINGMKLLKQATCDFKSRPITPSLNDVFQTKFDEADTNLIPHRPQNSSSQAIYLAPYSTNQIIFINIFFIIFNIFL